MLSFSFPPPFFGFIAASYVIHLFFPFLKIVHGSSLSLVSSTSSIYSTVSINQCCVTMILWAGIPLSNMSRIKYQHFFLERKNFKGTDELGKKIWNSQTAIDYNIPINKSGIGCFVSGIVLCVHGDGLECVRSHGHLQVEFEKKGLEQCINLPASVSLSVK